MARRYPPVTMELQAGPLLRRRYFMWRALDGIEDAAVDSSTSIIARGFSGLAAATLLAANCGAASGAAWMAAYIAVEAWVWAATRPRAIGAGSTAAALNFLAAAGAMTTTWSALGVMFWFAGPPGLKIAAIAIIAAQLVHAQSFSFRSVAMLAVNAGIPALELIILPLVFGDYSGTVLLTVAFALMISLFYVAVSARANLLSSTRLKKAQLELEKFAYFDALTLLGNRRLFAENLRNRIEVSTRHGTRFALMVIDVDRFKHINDTLGHGAGDTVLVEVGRRLRAAVAPDDDVARTGGDEFAILLAAADDPATIESTCRRICDCFIEAIDLDGSGVKTSASIGVACFPDDGAHSELLLRSADRALYASKAGGRGIWSVAAWPAATT